VAGGVNQGYAFRAAFYPAIHGVVPCFKGGASSRVGTLGENHKLFGKRVFIQPRGGVQKGSPAFPALRYPFSRMVGHLGIDL